jgi:hypothetical protein
MQLAIRGRMRVGHHPSVWRRGAAVRSGLLPGLAVLAGCAVIETRDGAGGSERRVVLGAPALVVNVAPGAQVETVEIRALGLVKSPHGMTLGYHAETAAYFPARCGAVLIRPSPEALARLGQIAPGIENDCLQPSERDPL